MRVGVCKYSTFGLDIKTHNARTHKWLIPYSFFVQNHIFSNQGDKLCFNALNFKRRNEYFFRSFCAPFRGSAIIQLGRQSSVLQIFRKRGKLFSLVRRKNFYFAKVCPIIIKQFFTSFGKHTIYHLKYLEYYGYCRYLPCFHCHPCHLLFSTFLLRKRENRG